jgi:galactokinase
MFVYAPKNPERVAEAINNAGGKSYLIQSDLGTKIEK